MITLTIQTEQGKGRSFQASLLAWIEAPDLFEGGQTDTRNTRPVWMAFASSEQENRAFSANLLRGRVAECGSGSRYNSPTKFQLLKTEHYQSHVKKIGGGAVTTAYLPDLFYPDPGMVDEKMIQFVLLTSQSWRDQQEGLDLEDVARFVAKKDLHMVEHGQRVELENLRDLLPEALLFLLYADRRSRYPMPIHPNFALQLMIRCLNEGIASRSQQSRYSYYNRGAQVTYLEHNLERLGIPPGLAFRTDHETFGRILASEIQRWRA